MHELPLQFTKGNWFYKQVSRDGPVAIYEMIHTQRVSAKRHEVILVQYHEERQVMGRTQEAGEYYPGYHQWGRHGWTTYTLQEAQELATKVRAKISLDS